ncbi:MAG: hypothetical protein HOC70_14035 [Gammaproteobacteria bacterium]|jgi:hypothetical protein|nr:hypothetical protein [Gammaproteobacteria bacterium]MBT4494357.1 hypothetical protein [Gammaproteobacteria bacterium]MBT7371152.1 hypothetical protein [Gammaproteobacteria bacterium]
MAKALMVVQSRCNDPKQLGEFHEWYNFHHLPDVVEADHFIKASRYRLVGTLGGAGSEEPLPFIALYEVDTDDVEALNKAVMEIMVAKGEKGRVLQHESCDVVTAGFYTFISEVAHVPAPSE